VYQSFGLDSAVWSGLCFCEQVFSIVFSRMLNVFYSHDDDRILQKTLELMGWFFLIGGVTGVTQFLQPYLFSIAGERLTRRLREDTFSVLMRQDVGYYDQDVSVWIVMSR
jgi:ABC-type multidrug transport system fused ATPase/permease subunit